MKDPVIDKAAQDLKSELEKSAKILRDLREEVRLRLHDVERFFQIAARNADVVEASQRHRGTKHCSLAHGDRLAPVAGVPSGKG